MKEIFEFKVFHRATAAALPGKSDEPSEETGCFIDLGRREEIHNQAMEHVNKIFYGKCYWNRIDNGIVSALLRIPSDEAIIKLVNHLSFTRDPNAPAELTAAQGLEIQADSEVVIIARSRQVYIELGCGCTAYHPIVLQVK